MIEPNDFSTKSTPHQQSLTALRANARVRIECAHHVKYSAAGSQRAPRSVGGTHAGWLARRPRT